MDAFLCVHRRDLDYLFPLAVTSLVRHFAPLRDLHVVTNDVSYARDVLAELIPGTAVSVTPDEQWLSASERGLPGWYRQQIVKLRSYEICGTELFTSLGADTILLREVTVDDVVAGGEPVLWKTRHRLPGVHYRYERGRVRHVGELLGVTPTRAARHVDFINDLFTFEAATLRRLDAHLVERYGPDPYGTLLAGRGTTVAEQQRFGEWTTYATFVLDVEGRSPTVRDTTDGFLTQIHTARHLRRFGYDSQVVHVVRKDLDVEQVRAGVASVP